MSKSGVKLSLVVPCYNEQENVDSLYEEAVSVLGQRGIPFEMIFVNDGSTDGTLSRLRDIVNRAQVRVRVVDFSRNFGKEAAMIPPPWGNTPSSWTATCSSRPAWCWRCMTFWKANPMWTA